jgi:hypothetical protein
MERKNSIKEILFNNNKLSVLTLALLGIITGGADSQV